MSWKERRGSGRVVQAKLEWPWFSYVVWFNKQINKQKGIFFQCLQLPRSLQKGKNMLSRNRNTSKLKKMGLVVECIKPPLPWPVMAGVFSLSFCAKFLIWSRFGLSFHFPRGLERAARIRVIWNKKPQWGMWRWQPYPPDESWAIWRIRNRCVSLWWNNQLGKRRKHLH